MADRVGALRRVLANPGLRRVELAFFGFGAAEYGVWVAVLVYAYQRGGTTASAAVAVAQLLPAAVVAPMAAVVADRHGGAVALRIGYLAQAVSIAASAAAMMLGAPAVVVYAGAVVAASAVTLTRPAQGALLPVLVDAPSELTAANVASGWVEAVSLLFGPAAAGLLIALDGPGAALAAFALVLAIAAALVAGVGAAPGAASAGRSDRAAEVVGGPAAVVRVLRREPRLAGVLALTSVQYVAIGALDVLQVVLAINMLGIGAGGAGYLGAAFGAGGILGALAAVAFVGRHRIAGALTGGALAWGGAYVALGLWPTVAGAFVLMAGCGMSRTVLDIGGRTMLHRAVPAAFHGRVFGVLEGLAMLGLALGSLSVPLLADIAGIDAAWIGVGAALVGVSALTAGTLRSLDRGSPTLAVELSLLRGHHVFGLLEMPALEDLARALVPRAVGAGEAVVREGERGGHFYLIAAGLMDVSIDGATVRALAPGDGFGEIALLRDGIRTATVTALTPATVFALDRAAFLEAVTGSHGARQAAEEFVAERLAADRSRALV